MSSDEAFIVEVLLALARSDLEALVIGSVAGLLQGAPITTEDLDLLVRDTPKNREKIRLLERDLGARAIQLSPLTNSIRLTTPRAHVDLLFDEISGGLSFESIRSRAHEVVLGEAVAVVASLEDIIAS